MKKTLNQMSEVEISLSLSKAYCKNKKIKPGNEHDEICRSGLLRLNARPAMHRPCGGY